ncbi:SLC13 family permease [Corynebacterium hansenii]|uniref:Sodium-dependent dicarboxylate transporter SdcS n=1 Tax=Corynebacterium hansenii TaxID=394964 RepID=A0ABV7ZRH9_9CORY|nr:SLC13 family permease [Corynebacterium hansenii]WJY99858.1 Sodium-dependent dicarboxylate transporter SdcS [Corynebacterium hansenii]
MSTTDATRRTATTAAELSPGQKDRGDGPRELFRKRFGLITGLVLSVAVYFFMPSDLDHMLRGTAAIAVLMAAWWMSEAIPITVTALLPLVLFPALGIAKIGDFSGEYTAPTIFLFMGGFLLALAMQRWNLHKRIALWVLVAMGSSPKLLILGFMVATGFLSMWVSNTATAVMMLPIGVSVLSLIVKIVRDEAKAEKAAPARGEGDEGLSEGASELLDADADVADGEEKAEHSTDPEPKSNFGIALMLGIAYAASIGSLGTIIGTPPNALLAGYMAKQGVHIGFGQWMLVGVPVAIVLMAAAWFLLTGVIFKPEIDHIPGGRALMKEELAKLGGMSRGELRVLLVFVAAALAWVFVPVIWPDTIIVDAVIAMAVGIALFIIPGGPDGVKLLRWEDALELPWGVLLLFGGGLALSKQFTDSGLSDWIGEQMSGLGFLPIALLVVAVALVVLVLTEFTSNTATAATFLPLVGAMAIGLGVDQMLLAVPVALAATSAFMMPVATPPNAIAYGSGYVSMGNMVRAGIWLNIIALVVVSAAAMTLLGWVFGVVY